MTIKLPSKFEFCTKYARATRYTLSLDSTTGKYICTASSLEDAYDLPATYSVEFVKAAIDCGNWIVTKVLDEVAVEREMVFPFTAHHKDFPDNVFTIEESLCEGYVNCISKGKAYLDEWSIDQCKTFIKEGIWIVKHVGEKAPVYDFAAALKKFPDEWEDGWSRKPPEQPVQAPQSTTLSNLSITITADTGAAVAGVERLRDAYEDLAISMESVIALCKELKGVA